MDTGSGDARRMGATFHGAFPVTRTHATPITNGFAARPQTRRPPR